MPDLRSRDRARAWTEAAILLASRAGDRVMGAMLPVDGGIVYANAGIRGRPGSLMGVFRVLMARKTGK